jgi:5-methylcytosine-specific restriction endonuclease McrA
MAYTGKTPKELGTAKWKNTRRYIRSRDGDRCRRCDASGAIQRLYVHHIVPRAQGGTDRYENLMLVCQSCHGKLEREAQQSIANVPSPAPRAVSKWLRPSEYGPQPVSRDWGGGCYLNPEWRDETQT